MIRKSKIVDHSNGPVIEGTRTTIYQVMDYYLDGWDPTRIAARLMLGTPDIEAAIEYIEAHRAEVDEDYRIIVERSERGNPPEIQALIEANRPLAEAKKVEILRRAREAKEAKLNKPHENGTPR